MPYFISSVGVAGMVISFIDTDGLVMQLLSVFGVPKQNLRINSGAFPWIYTVTNVWKSFGFGSILYFSPISSIDPGQYEAARIDGAGPLRIFWSIVMPLIRPILTTVVVFQTMSTWNDFMNANVFISSSNLRTIVLQVYNAVGQFSTDWPSFMTITVLALLPVFVFFIFCQKWIVSGLVAGSVKG